MVQARRLIMLNADDLYGRVPGLHVHRYAGDQAAAAHRDENDIRTAAQLLQ